jgi:hypothetical protein
MPWPDGQCGTSLTNSFSHIYAGFLLRGAGSSLGLDHAFGGEIPVKSVHRGV